MLSIFLMLLATEARAEKGHNCTCRYEGGDVAEGETACIKTAKGMSLARCGRVLNNTSWTILNKPCTIPKLSFSIKPATPGDT